MIEVGGVNPSHDTHSLDLCNQILFIYFPGMEMSSKNAKVVPYSQDTVE